MPSDTFADLDLNRSISDLGGKGAFSKEIQQVVLAGHANIAVHSAKDLQAFTPPGLVIAAYPTRGDARDALVGITLEQLTDRCSRFIDDPAGSQAGHVPPTVASGSNRRRALLLDRCPQVSFTELRGNIATRLGRLESTNGGSPVDGLIMASAALKRLGLSPAVVDHLDPLWYVPQVGQGALAVEANVEDHRIRALVKAIDDPVTRLAVEAERSFLAELGGDCNLPAGANATVDIVDRRIEISIAGVLAGDGYRNLQRSMESGPVEADPGRILAGNLRKALEAEV